MTFNRIPFVSQFKVNPSSPMTSPATLNARVVLIYMGNSLTLLPTLPGVIWNRQMKTRLKSLHLPSFYLSTGENLMIEQFSICYVLNAFLNDMRDDNEGKWVVKSHLTISHRKSDLLSKWKYSKCAVSFYEEDSGRQSCVKLHNGGKPNFPFEWIFGIHSRFISMTEWILFQKVQVPKSWVDVTWISGVSSVKWMAKDINECGIMRAFVKVICREVKCISINSYMRVCLGDFQMEAVCFGSGFNIFRSLHM